MGDTHNPLVHCKNCSAYVDEDFEGECRRHPPQIKVDINNGRMHSYFPVVDRDSWCCDFMPNAETLNKLQSQQSGRIMTLQKPN